MPLYEKIEVECRTLQEGIRKVIELVEQLKDVPPKEPPAPAPEGHVPQHTIEEVRDALRGVVGDDGDNGRARCREMLAKYGATKVSEVNPKDYDALYEEATLWKEIPF